MLGKDVSSAVVGCRVEVTLFHGVGSLFADVCLAVLYIIENEVLKSLLNLPVLLHIFGTLLLSLLHRFDGFSISLQNVQFSLATIFALNSILSAVSTATPTLFGWLFAGNIFFHPFPFNRFVS